MTESKTPKKAACMIIKKSMELSSPTKEDSSMDEWSSVKSGTSSSCSLDDWDFLCPICRREKFESRSETSSADDERESNNTYNISEADTTYSSSGSGYMSMDGSSSLDDSRRSNEEGSDTSCYYCDRSASSSSCSDTDSFYSESMSENNFYSPSLFEKGFIEN